MCKRYDEQFQWNLIYITQGGVCQHVWRCDGFDYISSNGAWIFQDLSEFYDPRWVSVIRYDECWGEIFFFLAKRSILSTGGAGCDVSRRERLFSYTLLCLLNTTWFQEFLNLMIFFRLLCIGVDKYINCYTLNLNRNDATVSFWWDCGGDCTIPSGWNSRL